MKYRITNISKKPGHTKGKFKRGFFVDVKPGGKVRPMWVGEHVDVDEVTPGILAMQKKEYISVEPIQDLDVQIKKQIQKNEEKSRQTIEDATKKLIRTKEDALKTAQELAEEARKPVKGVATPSSGLDKDAMKADAKLKKENTVQVTGEQMDTDPLGELENSVNPDGEPNFVVKSNSKNRNKSSRKK